MRYLKKAFYLVVFIGYSFSYAGSYDDFFSALGRDNVPQVKNLLRRGLDVNTVGPSGEAALLIALRQSSFQVAHLLIAQPGTQVEVRTAKDESPLMLAAIKGQLEICRQLIARDADVNKPGWTPLHYGASGGHPEVVQLLLDHYAYVDAESPNGTTPLMMAAQYGTPEAIQVLLRAGADPTLKNKLGLTALDFVRKSEHPDSEALIVRALGSKTEQGAW